MTSYVTGAAGFIGSHLVDRLLAAGHRVLGVDNFVLGKKANLANAFKNPNLLFQELDVNNFDAALAFVKQQGPIDAIWHMAANSDIQAGGREPDIDLRLTFLTTFTTVKLAEALKIPQIAFASSSAIYGDYPGLLREDAGPLFPISTYGAMKLASEGVLSAARERFLKRLWIFRFPNVVGSRATHGAIYDFIQKLRRNPRELEVLGDGSQEKPYLHVSELVDAMLHLFQKTQEPLNYFNIAPAGEGTTVRFIAETTVRIVSPNAKIRYMGGSKGWVGDVPKFAYSIDKLKATGWSPKISSNAAVELAIRENAECDS
ncbi:MAG TPA: NAD-dependent epimerase/dehydratase family protein [Candidatus Binatia bacterium]|nr:NAD-dependent epimerase/dehydratase family protein [Candidatus Binatia bacterium]